MTHFILQIYDHLSRHRLLTILLLVLLLGLCILLSLRIRYQENVVAFLPHNEKNDKYIDVYNSMSGQGRITIIFRCENEDENHRIYSILDAVDEFEDNWNMANAEAPVPIALQCHVDQSQVLDAIKYVRNNIACFLTPEDYRRIDSLLLDSHYVETTLTNVKQMLSFPMGDIAEDAIIHDPLNLFSPVMQRFSSLNAFTQFDVNEDVIFDYDGNGYAFIDSPWGGSDTRNNEYLAKKIDSVITKTMDSNPEVMVTAVGPPLIAVANATQIKHDSVLAILLSSFLIVAILFFTIRRKRNILLLGLSVVVGWFFAIALIALFKPTISLIVIGIGSVLVGIAVNYPIHYLDHLGEYPNRREALKEMVEPLVTGNITTVSAFACLVLVKADAMRDLGLFGSLMLIGTILFVLFFLPQLAKVGTHKRKKTYIQDEEPIKNNACIRKIANWLFFPVLTITIILGLFSKQTQFDSDLHNINYMTTQQAEDLALLSRAMEDSVSVIEYIVTEGASLDSVLEQNSVFLNDSPIFLGCECSGVVDILPSISQQTKSLDGWTSFRAKYPLLEQEVLSKAQKVGFTDKAFAPFLQLLAKNYTPKDPVKMSQLLALTSNYVLQSDSLQRVVSLVTIPAAQSQDVKNFIRSHSQQGNTFIFDIKDVSDNLVESLSADFNYILYVCSFVVFFFLWISFRRLELAIITFLPMMVGWLWILGLMDLLAVKFNIVNIILATFIFGQGDDYTIFITEGLLYENAYGRRRLKTYRRSVIVSALLMFVGMGTLIFAKHPAMRSLAEVAIIGMATVVIMACYLPPLIYRWLTQLHGIRRDVPITIPRILNTFLVLMVFFIASFVLITPYTLLYRVIGKDSAKKRLRFHCIIQLFTYLAVTHLPAVKFRYDNTIGEDFSRPAVIVANHQSHLDLICMLQMTPKMVILTNDWVWRNPIYGAIIRYAEFYPVSNGYDFNIQKLRSLVDRGYSILVFPEGTRSIDGNIGRFHKGAFQMAQELNVDILPVFIHGASHVMPKNDIFLRKGQLTVEITPRIPSSQLNQLDARQLTANIHGFYLQHFSEMRLCLETEEYYRSYVLAQYLYKGREIEKNARKALKEYFATGKYSLGQGEIALLKALAHTDQVFSYQFDNKDDYLVAINCTGIPSNLHYSLKETRVDDKSNLIIRISDSNK